MEFLHAVPSQEEDILDFINYVFSSAHVPHDFKKLLPFVYGRKGFYDLHLVALENDKIKGTVALLPFLMRVGNESLNAGFIGSVSAHPYERGRGVMKGLMALENKEAEGKNMDLVFLSGMRHRYNYFGFERFGTNFAFTLNEDSARHALNEIDSENCEIVPFSEASNKNIDSAYNIFLRKQLVCAKRSFEEFKQKASSWKNEGFLFLHKGIVKGYFIYSSRNTAEEMCVENESALPCLKLILERFGNSKIICPAWNKELFEKAEQVCESYNIFSSDMLRVYNWENVLNAGMKLKAAQTALQRGRLVLGIERAGTFCIEVNKENAAAYKTNEEASVEFTQEKAVQALFSPLGLFKQKCNAFSSWLPMSLELSSPDGF